MWGGGGGGLSCVVDHTLQEFNTLFLTRFRTYKIAKPPQTKTPVKTTFTFMISTFFCRFESLGGEVVKPRTILRLVPAPFLLLYLDDRDLSFQADFGPAVTTTSEDQEQDDDTDDVPRRRRKRFVEITADLLEDGAVPVSNDIGAWDVVMTKNKPSLTSPSPSPVTMTATTAAVKRRKKNKLTSKKSAKHSADRRRMENEVLSFDDDDVAAGLSLDDGDDGDDDGEDDEDEVLSLDYEEDDLSEQEADRFRWSTGSRMSSSPSTGSGSDLIPLPRGYKSQRGGSGGKRRIKQKKSKQGNVRANTEAAAPKGTVSKPRGLLPSLWKSFEAQVLF